MKSNKFKLAKSVEEFLKSNLISYKKIIPIGDGISNLNFLLDDKLVLKIGNINFFDKNNLERINFQNELAKNHLSSQIVCFDIQNNLSISKYIPNLSKIDVNNINLLQIEKIVEVIKTYQKFNLSLPKLNYQKLLNQYRINIPVDKRIYLEKVENSSLLNLEYEPSHFDLVDNNILFDKMQNCYIIDFEMAYLAPINFDLTSLISENEFSSEIKESIIESYFSDNNKLNFFKANLDMYIAILDLLWYHWGIYKSICDCNDKKEIFLDIAKNKKEDLLKRISMFK